MRELKAPGENQRRRRGGDPVDGKGRASWVPPGTDKKAGLTGLCQLQGHG